MASVLPPKALILSMISTTCLLLNFCGKPATASTVWPATLGFTSTLADPVVTVGLVNGFASAIGGVFALTTSGVIAVGGFLVSAATTGGV